MSFVDALKGIATGAGVGVLALTALPVFGAIGTITATGAVVGSVVGGVAGLADELKKDA